MHLTHLHRIIKSKYHLKPAYYFNWDFYTGSLTLRILEFGPNTGAIGKIDVYPGLYFRMAKNTLITSFTTKSAYQRFLKRLRSTM
jgi:hypothetical protein